MLGHSCGHWQGWIQHDLVGGGGALPALMIICPVLELC